MNKPRYIFPWRNAGRAILGAVIFLIMLVSFPDTTAKILILLTLVYAVFVTTGWIRLRRNQKRVDEINPELASEFPDEEQFRPLKMTKRKNLHKHRWRFVPYIAFSVALLGILLIQYFRNVGSLTPRKDSFLTMIVALAASIFCGWNLIWGVIEERISVRSFPNICRKESPSNYWVAIYGTAILTGGFLSAFVSKLIGLFLQ